LVIDHLHIVGDIFDRGPGPHIIMDTLLNYHSVDIQWGNHDISWMGAASGHMACIANVLRMAATYGTLASIEDGYGINLLPLATFALETYGEDDCKVFKIRYNSDEYDTHDMELDKRMQKAIAIIQFKLEGQVIMRNPDFFMDDRLLLDKIDYKKGTICIEGKEYSLRDTNFPTIDPADPYKLSPGEQLVMERLQSAFVHCEKLQHHVSFLYAKGGLYRIFNGNLLYHGCVPMNEDGSFAKVRVLDKEYSGKALYDVLELHARRGYYAKDVRDKEIGQDILWYISCGPGSPVFGKNRITTFERYFIEEKETHKEVKNSYYRLYEQHEVINSIFKEFGLNKETAHIINGHVPVEQIHGESPIKCDGKLLVIDGGFSKAYHEKTGIAGYTLVCNSRGMRLAAHETFESAEVAIQNESDIVSDSIVVENFRYRMMVADTDEGKEIKETIYYLEQLLEAYREGTIKEGSSFRK